METKKFKPGFIIAFVIVILALIGSVFGGFYRLSKGLLPVMSILTMILDIGIIYYLFAGYKVPHGNMMKFLFLFFALVLSAKGARSIEYSRILPVLFNVSAVLIAFGAGRLNRIKELRVLLCIVLVLVLAAFIRLAVLFPSSFSDLLGLPGLLDLVALAGAYFVRYAQHKEAGFIEDNKA